MIELLVKGGVCYLVGSMVASLLVGRLRGVDIRTLGSGNAGATNAMRTLGGKIALVVLVFDLLKGWIATGWIASWALSPSITATPAVLLWSAPVCGLAVMLGHVYPVWYGFRGGKGMATLLGCAVGIHAWLALPMLVTWLATVVLLGFVSLGSILSAAALAISLAATGAGVPLITYGVLALLLIVFTHRANIARIRAGTESRARRLWLLGTRRGRV
ncbi:MAG: glycerol-3-phosphate 1-O-acyltransferase PlsY [Gammaproteobacteria bacterium]|nr:glycerol-3-phosphate 1-O-acyltransferase PlsY [Gammaproteobacteria bacterium]